MSPTKSGKKPVISHAPPPPLLSRIWEKIRYVLSNRPILIRTAAMVVPLALAGSYYCKTRTEKNFWTQEFATKPYPLLHGYQDIRRVVGFPYRTGKPNLGENDVNYTTGLEASVFIDVRGPLRQCNVQAWSSREKLGDSWEVDKMDMECDEAVWTFYINPKKRDTIKPTVCASAIKQKDKQAIEQATESVQTKKMHSSESQAAGQAIERAAVRENSGDTVSVQTRKMNSSESGQNEKASKS